MTVDRTHTKLLLYKVIQYFRDILFYEYPYIYPELIIFVKKTSYMTLIDFISEFPDEESCKQKFKEYRDQVGVVCSQCGGSAVSLRS